MVAEGVLAARGEGDQGRGRVGCGRGGGAGLSEGDAVVWWGEDGEVGEGVLGGGGRVKGTIYDASWMIDE